MGALNPDGAFVSERETEAFTRRLEHFMQRQGYRSLSAPKEITYRQVSNWATSSFLRDTAPVMRDARAAYKAKERAALRSEREAAARAAAADGAAAAAAAKSDSATHAEL